MNLVIIESPYAGDIERNLAYVRAAMRDCLMRGESPFASHALYTQPGVLRDEVREERALGIEAGYAWRDYGRMHTYFYVDLGWSLGMLEAKAHCEKMGLRWSTRSIEGWADDPDAWYATELARLKDRAPA
jgi:hypothetical protein